MSAAMRQMAARRSIHLSYVSTPAVIRSGPVLSRFGPMVYRITCVCLGNICRSPMAEVVIRHEIESAGLADRVIVESAGTGHWHVGHDADPRARLTLESAGYTFEHAARQFEPQWFSDSDLILAMDSENLTNLQNLAETYGETAPDIRLLRSFDPTAETNAEVPDPYYGGEEGFTEVLHMVQRAATGVVDSVSAELAK